MITLKQYNPGEIIFKENEDGETAYIIERGIVAVIKQMEGQDVHLAHLESGDIFGEMSLIDERPRSATIKAVEETVVREIPRNEFSQSLQKDPQAALSLLKVLFERLREANVTILQLQKDAPPSCHVPHLLPSQISERPKFAVQLEGLTSRAINGLPSNPLTFSKFPFRIGRKSHDPLVNNDLMISDSEPYQISIHHVAFVETDEHVGILDRGSRLGTLVDGQQLGGAKGDPKPFILASAESTLVLGTIDSYYKYRVSLVPQ